MKKWKRMLGIFMSGAVFLTGGVLPQKNAATAERATDYGISSPRIKNGVTTWDKIKFGSYYQDGEAQPAEPIKWRVLWVNENDAFLLADQILDDKPYNEECEDVTWETCTLRKWLNEDFYNEAFDDDEKEAVMETTVVNEDNQKYGTEGGNDTEDKVYLLSIEEACSLDYGFDAEFREETKTREAKNTDYAKANGAWSWPWSGYDGNGNWWLRSPGDDSDIASDVDHDGSGLDYYSDVDYRRGIRPALHINLSSSKVKDAGKVDSEGNVTMSDGKIHNPTVENGVTTWNCVYFGNYRQNFSVKQDIEWRVLSVDGDDAFLLADKNLDAKPYNEEQENVIWEACTLRKWLNEDFYNEAFTNEEKENIRNTIIVNEDDEGNEYNIEDKVYLLSVEEAISADYGFEEGFGYNGKSRTREVKNTGYAKVHSVDGYTSRAGNGGWWLRRGYYSDRALYVKDDGRTNSDAYVSYDCGGVRPVLHINLSSSSWSPAGQVTAMRSVDDPSAASPKPVPTNNPTDYGISSPRIKNEVTTWDKIKFGSYYQDVEAQPAEPIKWRVLSVDGDDAFLLADQILDAKPYNEEEEKDETWETCTLRKWLNNDFYKEAFDDAEQEAIKETRVVNENNPKYDTEGGNATDDKVYLLSIAEACNEKYGFDTHDEASKTREAKNTDSAKAKGVATSDEDSTAGNGNWWLRSPGRYSDYASYSSYSYGIDYNNMSRGDYGVRPVLHINLLSSKVTYAGEVDSDGNVTMSDGEIKNPTVENGVTTWDCVYFGNYRQNFSVKQDIEWRVLSVDGDDAFLLADKNLDCKPYNEETKDVTWETCTLRKWLNEDFFREAFDDEEQGAVIETTVINADNPEYYTEGGNDTKDKVFLLSRAEASNVEYGFDTTNYGYMKKSKTREAKNTDYARLNNAYTTVPWDDGTDGNGYWWLRLPGEDNRSAVAIQSTGEAYYFGYYVSGTYFEPAVRPALHINLSSFIWSYAGEVSSAEQEDDTPTASPEPTEAPTPEPSKEPTPTDEPTVTLEPTKEPSPTDEPTVTLEPTKEPSPTDGPTASPEPTKEPSPTDKPTASPEPEPTTTPTVTAQPTPPSMETPNPVQTPAPVLKQLKLSSVKCAKNAKKITGKVSVSKAAVKIKVGKKAYKKAAVKGRKFTLKLNYKLKKKTKVIIKAEKKGYKGVVKSYTVK